MQNEIIWIRAHEDIECKIKSHFLEWVPLWMEKSLSRCQEAYGEFVVVGDASAVGVFRVKRKKRKEAFWKDEE